MSTRSPAAVAMSRALLADPERPRFIRLGSDVHCGAATVLWADGAWRLPGCMATRDADAVWNAAIIINRLMQW